MLVNLRKSQLLDTCTLYINGETIYSEKSVKLLENILDKELNFCEHISSLYKRAFNQLSVFIYFRGKWASRKRKY